jgi:hypothetical protein
MIDQNETAICVNCEYHKRMYLKAHNSVIEMQDDLTELWEALERSSFTQTKSVNTVL